jgi:heat shock protein HtpX
MMRILLFLGTNIAIIALISITFRVLGIDNLLAENNVDLDMQALLIYSAIIGFSGAFISLFLSKFMAKKTMGVHLIESPQNRDEMWLMNTVQRQADAAGIKMPEVGIFEGAPNAFATGWNKNDALVGVSTGLLQTMNHDEVEAVLAHEISHVANGDMVTLTLIQGVVNTFVVFLSRVIGHFVDRVVFKVEQGHGPAFWITSLAAQFILGILATIIVMWFSRWREYRADAGGANLSSRQKMISALRRLKDASGPNPMPDEMAAFGITGKGLKELFSSHPPLDDRIRALEAGR